MSKEDYCRGGARAGDDSDFCELARAVGLARRGAGFMGMRLMISRIIGRQDIRDGDDRLLGKYFVGFLLGDGVRFGAGGDAEVAGDGDDADFAGREDGDLGGGGRFTLGGDANVRGNDFDVVAVVAPEGECAGAQFGDGAFSTVRWIEATMGTCCEAITGIRDANVGGAADVSADFFAGKNAGAFGKATLADMGKVRLEHDAKWRVLRG